MGIKIFAHEIVLHGVEHSDYFQGCGVSHTEFDEVFTGIGDSPRAAYDDAEEQMHMSLSPIEGDEELVTEARELSSLGVTLGDGQHYFVSIRVRMFPMRCRECGRPDESDSGHCDDCSSR